MSEAQQRWALRIIVYVMLVLSAGTAFLFGTRMWAAARLGTLPIWAPLLAPSLFTLFVVVYAADRWLLVRRRRSSLARAFFQVAFAIVFLTLLWPQQAAEYRSVLEGRPPAPDHAVSLLSHDDPMVRATACEVIGLRAQIVSYPEIQPLATDDPSELVRRTCAEALQRLSAARDKAAPEPEP